MIKYGIECEYWVAEDITKEGIKGVCLVPDGIPMDSCGFLAEVRGDPHQDIDKAIALFRVERERVRMALAKKKLIMTNEIPTWRPPRELIIEALRKYGKSAYPQERGNIYGKNYRHSTYRDVRAGMHIHFSDTHTDSNNKTVISRQLDLPRIIQHFDKAFAAEIKDAKRLPGFYQIKPYGFEYRSLPCNALLSKIKDVVHSLGL